MSLLLSIVIKDGNNYLMRSIRGIITDDVDKVKPAQTAQGADTFLLRVMVDFATYRQIETEQWFNFLPQVRYETMPDTLAAGQPQSSLMATRIPNLFSKTVTPKGNHSSQQVDNQIMCRLAG